MARNLETIVADVIKSPDGTASVLVSALAAADAQLPIAAAVLTDNSGGATADGTIAVITAPTAVTDSSGGSASATLAAQTLPTALTDNGGGTADGTVSSQAAPTTLTDNTGQSGTHDDTLAAVTVPADATGGEDPTEAEFNALLAVVRVMAQNQSDVAQKVIELVTLEGVTQNNFKEVTTTLAAIRAQLVILQNVTASFAARQAENRAAIVASADAVKELATKQNEVIGELN